MRRALEQLVQRILISVLLALPLLSYLAWITNRTPTHQRNVLLLAIASVVFGLIALLRSRNDAEKILLALVIGAGLLIIAGVWWNTLFLNYVHSTGYEGDIFRRFLQNLHTPIYGTSTWSKWPWSLLLILFSSAFVVRVLYWSDTWIEFRGLAIELLVWFTGFILVFALSDSPARLLTTISHYKTFASDIPSFEGFRHTLQNYTQQMPNLSVHNGHYPPGNLLLLTVESRLGVSWFARAVVICFTILTMIPIVGITSELNLSTYTRHMALGLFISSPAVLSLPSVAMAPIPMFLAATALWLTLAAIRRDSSLYSAAVGVVMTIYSYISFTSVVTWGLLASIAAVQMLFDNVHPRVVLKFGCIAATCFLLLCWLFYLFTEFNLLNSFLAAVEHNHRTMTSGFDSLVRYFLRSTGNLIAWMCSIGFAASILGIMAGSNALRRPSVGNPRQAAFIVAVFGTVLLAAFSTLFFLETERVWLFFTPPWVVGAAVAVGNVSEKQKVYLLKSLLIFSIILATGQELVFEPFTW
jgi:hypothetical protein